MESYTAYTYNKGKGKFLYDAVSSKKDHSKHFKVHPMEDLPIPTPTLLLLEAFNHAAITAQILFGHIYLQLSIARYSFIQLSELSTARYSFIQLSELSTARYSFIQLSELSTARYSFIQLSELSTARYSFIQLSELSTARYSFIQLSELSTARYSFIQLSELRQCRVNEIAKTFKWQQEDSKPSSLD